MRAYLNGLKYIYDHRDEAAVYIMSKSCALISDYLLAGLTGQLDPAKVDYETFYKTKFEQGLIGDPGSYKVAPVVNRSWGWKGQLQDYQLNYRGSINGINVYAYLRGDLYTKNTDIPIEYQGITAEELEKVKGDKKYERFFSEIAKFQGNLTNVYNSLGNVKYSIVQRRNSYNDTHFFIMMRMGSDYLLFDHNDAYFNPKRWGRKYDRESDYIVRFMWN